MRPRRTRRSVTRARWPPKKIAGSPSTLAHWMAGRCLVVGRNDSPAARFGLEEEIDEVGIGNAEQRLDAFGFEQVEDALVDRGAL